MGLYLAQLSHTAAPHNANEERRKSSSGDLGLEIDIVELKDISEQYNGEDKVITVNLPVLHFIVPLKTVEAFVKIYNSVDKAIKSSAKTFMTEMAAIRKKHLHTRKYEQGMKKNEVASILKVDAEAGIDLTKRSHASGSESTDKCLETNGNHSVSDRIAVRLHLVIVEATIEFTYDLKEPLLIVAQKGIDLLHVVYDSCETTLHSFNFDLNSFHNSSNQSKKKPRVWKDNAFKKAYVNNKGNRLGQFGSDTKALSTISGDTVTQYVVAKVKSTVVRGNCLIDENGPMYGVYTSPSAAIGAIHVTALLCSNTANVSSHEVRKINLAVAKFACEISRNYSQSDSSKQFFDTS